MTVRELISVNRKNKTKVKRLMEVKRYYLSMYRCYMLKMYDMNYISDPTRFNKAQIIQNIVELGISDLFNYSGKVELNSAHVLFALYKNKNDDEKSEFLKVLYNILKYQEFSKTVDNIYEEFNFREKDSNVIKSTMTIKGAMVVQRSGISFNEAVARCISTFEEETKYVTIDNELWDLAMAELKIPKEDWYKDGVFDKGLTHKEEVECIEGILNGYFRISGGKYTETLHNWLLSHRWNINSMFRADMQGLFDYLFKSEINSIEDILNIKLSDFDGTDKKVLVIQKDKIYYNVKREFIKMPFGVFTVVCDVDKDEYLLPDGNSVYGYTGEVYTENRLIEDGINYVGCPIILYESASKASVFYDLEQTDIKSSSWFDSDDEITVVFDKNAKLPFKSMYNVDTLGKSMEDGYVNSLRSADTLISDIPVSSFDEFEKTRKDIFKSL